MHRHTSAALLLGLALVAGSGGAGYAAGKITGQQVKNGSLTGRDLRDASVDGRDVAGLTGADLVADSVSGDQVDESRLGPVPAAARAATADRLGELGPQDVLTRSGCQDGALHGAARVDPHGGTLPASYTQAPQWIGSVHNCSGAAVQVRRSDPGTYFVKFLQNPTDLVVVQPDSSTGPVCPAVTRIQGAGIDVNAFRVQLFDCSDSFLVDRGFTVVLP